MSIRAGANALYRDQSEEDSFQVREYDDHWTVEMDRYNPDEGPAVQHALMDAAKYTALSLAALGVAAAASS